METNNFDYDLAFSRNIGWFSKGEQALLKNKRIAIAGCGGVGCIHALTLARLGVSQFHIADFDAFSVENFNRQVGATISTLGQPKIGVVSDMLLDINPNMNVKCFPEGINQSNIEAFLDGVDLYIDSLDFFAIDARCEVFESCAAQLVPAVTAAPLGMGTAVLCFTPDSMTFEDYFGMRGRPQIEQFLRFYLGLAPASLQSEYLVDPSRINLAEKRAPSTIIGCTMSASVAATYAVKILLDRGELVVAPEGVHWDPYVNKMEVTAMPGGHISAEFQTKLAAAKKAFNI